MRQDPREVYPALPLRLARHLWWSRFSRDRGQAVAHCAHLDASAAAPVQLKPDWVWLYRQPKPLAVRQPARPPIDVCVDCLLALLASELASYRGRVIAFEPATEGFTHYVFIEQQHLGDVGLGPEDLIHCQSLVAEPLGGCQTCASEAHFLWVKRGSTTESRQLITYRGGRGYYCLTHGAEVLLAHLRERVCGPLAHFNFPYGERGVYIPTCA